MESGKYRFLSKKGWPFTVAAYTHEDLADLMDMYENFSPRPASQGIPPAGKESCRAWVKGLLDGGQNFLARTPDRVIGHATIIPDYARGDCEFLIFVTQSFRNQGVGTQLTRLALDSARRLGLASVLLTVEAHNLRAIGLYRNFRFEFCDVDEWERVMVLKI